MKQDVQYIQIAAVLKNLSNPLRLKILCLLLNQPLNVGEIVEKTNVSQSLVSQALAKLRGDNIIGFTKKYKVVTYFILDKNVKNIIGALYKIFCD
jgi:DNA-binding transcriptional ArsR family regulator